MFQARAIHIAAHNGDTAMVSLLLTSRAKTDVRAIQSWTDEQHSKHFGRTPLHIAAHSGHKDTVSLLLLYTKNIDVYDNLYATPLLLSIIAHQTETAALLLKNGAHPDPGPITLRLEVNAGLRNVLHHTAAEGKNDILELLVQHPLVNANKWINLLDLVREGGDARTFAILVAAGANIGVVDEGQGGSIMHAAAHNHRWDLMEALAQLGAEVDAVDSEGRTVLFHAAWVRLPFHFGMNRERYGAKLKSKQEVARDNIKRMLLLGADVAKAVRKARAEDRQTVIDELEKVHSEVAGKKKLVHTCVSNED
jgi:ankyrin repeat protein